MTGGWRWQDRDQQAGLMDETHLVRRVVGIHEIRFDGLSDLLLRAHGASVFDVGCNRGHVGWDFAMNGASIVHGCDIHGPSVQCARLWFSEHPHVESKFEVVDLTKGPDAIKETFPTGQYDIVLLLGVQHKLKRTMKADQISELIKYLGERTLTYFAWNGDGNDLDLAEDALEGTGLETVHYSELNKPKWPSVIWKRR